MDEKSVTRVGLFITLAVLLPLPFFCTALHFFSLILSYSFIVFKVWK